MVKGWGAGLLLPLLISYQVVGAADSIPSCFHIFRGDYFKYKVGRKLNVAPLKGLDDHQFYFLGRGQMGGDVYRMISPDDQSLVLKRYERKENRENDVYAFDLIRQSLGLAASVRVVRMLRLRGEHDMYLEDVRGQSYEHVLKSKELDWELRRKIQDVYEAALGQIDQNIRRLGTIVRFGREVDAVSALILVPGRTQPVTIYVKPDNVIVDARTLELVIVDPF